MIFLVILRTSNVWYYHIPDGQGGVTSQPFFFLHRDKQEQYLTHLKTDANECLEAVNKDQKQP